MRPSLCVFFVPVLLATALAQSTVQLPAFTSVPIIEDVELYAAFFSYQQGLIATMNAAITADPTKATQLNQQMAATLGVTSAELPSIISTLQQVTQHYSNLAADSKAGAVISIRVNDPGGFLSQNEGRTPGADLLVGVPNDASAFELARKVSENAQGRDLQLVVPFNVAAQLVVRSAFYQVAAGGVSLSSAGFIPIAVAQGQQPAAITLTITGGGH